MRREVHHRVHALQRRAERFRVGDVTPDEPHAWVELRTGLARWRRVEIEGQHLVTFLEQRSTRVLADVSERARHQNLHGEACPCARCDGVPIPRPLGYSRSAM